MKNNEALITFASWEDRFRLGPVRNLEKIKSRKVLAFYFSSYAERTKTNRALLEETCKSQDIEYVPVCLGIDDPASNWRAVTDSVESFIKNCQSVLVDISTMPREIIWYILREIEQSAGQNSMAKRYVYYSPERYSDEWLSRDPRSPRLVYKLSGVALPSFKTALLVTVGFDPQRAERLISWCEPAKLMIGVQRPSSFTRNTRAMESYNETFKKFRKEYDCEVFDLDAYAEDRGMNTIRRILEPFASSYNIIMSSLGPKLTAITLYKLRRMNPAMGLVYAPSNQFSPDYSSGIGQNFEGIL